MRYTQPKNLTRSRIADMGNTKTAPAFRILWPHGEITEARSATEFILRTAKAQWSDTSFQEMKNQLANRALSFPDGTGQWINPYQPDDAFVRELFRVGLFDLEEDGVRLERRRK